MPEITAFSVLFFENRQKMRFMWYLQRFSDISLSFASARNSQKNSLGVDIADSRRPSNRV